ncbi:MAG: glycosyltransferase family 4 protein [Bacteroidales bacterium]|nr:glycosyltransferase family 4 protein [Bacteroidales bacterium]
MLSCLHGLYDDRIYWKEALSLKKCGYEVIHLGVSDEKYDKISDEGIRLISIKRKIYFQNLFLDKIFKTFTQKSGIYSELLKTAVTLKADVYHIHDIQLNRISHKLKSSQHSPRIIYDVHEPYDIIARYTLRGTFIGKIFSNLYSIYLKWWEFKKSKYSDMILTTEENVNSKFQRIFPHKKVEIIYNYPDLKNLLSKKTEVNKIFDCIYTGNIMRRRGAITMLETILYLKKQGQNYSLLIIGAINEPKLEMEMNDFVARNNLSELIIIKKSVPYKEIHQYYLTSRIGLALFDDNPIYHTILPIKTFEYMAFGLPLICSNFGHIANFVQKENAGELVDPGNIPQIAGKISYLLTHKEIMETYSNNGQVAVKNKYNWSIMEEKLSGLYFSLFNKEPGT